MYSNTWVFDCIVSVNMLAEWEVFTRCYRFFSSLQPAALNSLQKYSLNTKLYNSLAMHLNIFISLTETRSRHELMCNFFLCSFTHKCHINATFNYICCVNLSICLLCTIIACIYGIICKVDKQIVAFFVLFALHSVCLYGICTRFISYSCGWRIFLYSFLVLVQNFTSI